MQQQQYLYIINFNSNESELSKLESRQLFNEDVAGKMHFSDIEIVPSSSPFIKKRMDILYSSNNYQDLIDKVEKMEIKVEGFKAEYIMLEGDTIGYKERLGQLRDIGYRIEGEPDYYNPTVTYGLCFFEGYWYFGTVIRDDAEWQKHNQKPCSFSNSLSINTAKALVNIASKGDKSKAIIDACCGVGTVLLEGCFSGFNIEGCDINWKASNHTQKNLEHYQYTTNIYNCDIKDLDKTYDAAIIDLPYNLYSASSDEIAFNIIEATALKAPRVVIISITNIDEFIQKAGLKTIDKCTIDKIGKVKFTRYLHVCERAE
ncbi:hypothetical protein [Flammeovirga sp. SubArs3]|uniref:TRM11 family SAM-dependent methyltransferase n=1 Tax=Flammeovirga sp. SubArs3 TaxID=2995316 RepID=UPI00248C8D15|nr:hypothetical protein [Flammeovirga sp. SubArs3]